MLATVIRCDRFKTSALTIPICVVEGVSSKVVVVVVVGRCLLLFSEVLRPRNHIRIPCDPVRHLLVLGQSICLQQHPFSLSF
jgi:hypothetical protein